MQTLSTEFLAELSARAKQSPRLRQHHNLHSSYQDPCQRLLNAIEPGSYIRPHRHKSDPKDEMLIVIRGKMALFTFDEQGLVGDITVLGAENYGADLACGAQLQPGDWHTVVALVSDCILLETKAGPFDPASPKDLAPWAPEEGSAAARPYLKELALQARQAD